MANIFSKGTNVKLSGTGASGEYAYLDPAIIKPEGGSITWYIEYVKGNGTSVALTAVAMDKDVSTTTWFDRIIETMAGVLQQWSSGSIGSSGNLAYTINYPRGCIPGLCITFTGGTTATVKVSAKVER
jgi:hypothetical protein